MDLGETDRILTVLSEQHGKLRVIAKGIRKPSSRLSAHLELFAQSRVSITRGRELDLVTGAEATDVHAGLREDLSAFGAASHCVELVDRFLQDDDSHPRVYRYLLAALRDLATGRDDFKVLREFEFRLLDEMGVRPELFTCVLCGKQVKAEPNRFSSKSGGILCTDHAESDLGAPELSLPSQKLLRLLSRGGFDEFSAIEIPESVRDEIEFVLGSFVRHQLERDLVSLKVRRRVEESLPVWIDQTSTKYV
jgi:DNA repair protein RecO (recombination protein O)